MEKLEDSVAIVTSDLHIKHWSDFNPNEEQMNIENNPLNFSKDSYRFSQYLYIAHRINYECKKHNTHTVFILGDLIDSPTNPPEVINMLRSFIKIINDQGNTIHYILGQHDALIRHKDLVLDTETFVGTIRNDKFLYENGNQYQMGNQIIEFQNFDFSNKCVFKDDTTVALGHISLDFGQTPVGKSLKMVVAGDIHDLIDNKTEQFEYHSCATPVVLHPHQSMNGYISVLNCAGDTPKFERISSSGEISLENDGKVQQFTLFDILSSDDWKENLLNKMLAEKNKEELKDASIESQNIFNSENIEESVKEIAKENDYTDILDELDVKDVPKPIDFSFNLISLKIENFRSIKELKINFKDWDGCTFLSAKNGVGKSSIILAIQTALLGDRAIKSYVKIGEKNLLLDLLMTYKNKYYRIVRQASKTAFSYTDDITSEKWTEVLLTKREIEAKIFEELPFLNYIHYFICHANSHFFDNVDRTQLIMDIFNLNAVESYKKSIQEVQSNTKKDLLNETKNGEVLKALFDNYTEEKNNLQKSLDEIKSGDVKIIEKAKAKFMYLNKLHSQINTEKTLIKTYQSSIDNLKTKLGQYIYKDPDGTNKALEQWRQYNQLKKTADDGEKEIAQERKSLGDLIALKDKLLATPKCKCPKCFTEFHIKGIADKAQEFMKEIGDKSTDISMKERDLELIKTGLSTFEKPKVTEAELQKYLADNSVIKELSNNLTEQMKKQKETEEKLNPDIEMENKILNGKEINEFLKELSDSMVLQGKIDNLTAEIAKKENQLKVGQEKINDSEKKQKELAKKVERCEGFIQLFDMNNLNSIPYKLIDKVIHNLDNQRIRFTSTKELSNGEARFNIDAEMQTSNDIWIKYSQCSDGEKCILDLYIILSLAKSLPKIGLCILDEFASNMDEMNQLIYNDVLRNLSENFKNLIYTSHSGQNYFHNNLIKLEKINGNTQIIS